MGGFVEATAKVGQQRCERFDGEGSFRGEFLLVAQFGNSFKEADFALHGSREDLLDGGVADVAGRSVDDPQQRLLIERLSDHAQVCQQIADLLVDEEGSLAQQQIRHLETAKLHLEDSRLLVRAEQDREVIRLGSVVPEIEVDLAHDCFGFDFFVLVFAVAHGTGDAARGDELLVMPIAIVLHKTVGETEDLLGAAIVLDEPYHLRPGKHGRKLQDV